MVASGALAAKRPRREGRTLNCNVGGSARQWETPLDDPHLDPIQEVMTISKELPVRPSHDLPPWCRPVLFGNSKQVAHSSDQTREPRSGFRSGKNSSNAQIASQRSQ